ncbi:hypothetical protein Tco_0720111 [Tanacetum coccineum]
MIEYKGTGIDAMGKCPWGGETASKTEEVEINIQFLGSCRVTVGSDHAHLDSLNGPITNVSILLVQYLALERFTLLLLEHQDVISKFRGPSRWKELSKETGSKILPSGDGSCWKTFKPIACLIAKGKLK